MIKYENIKVVNKGQIRAMYGSFFSAVFMGLLVLIVACMKFFKSIFRGW